MTTKAKFIQNKDAAKHFPPSPAFFTACKQYTLQTIPGMFPGALGSACVCVCVSGCWWHSLDGSSAAWDKMRRMSTEDQPDRPDQPISSCDWSSFLGHISEAVGRLISVLELPKGLKIGSKLCLDHPEAAANWSGNVDADVNITDRRPMVAKLPWTEVSYHQHWCIIGSGKWK